MNKTQIFFIIGLLLVFSDNIYIQALGVVAFIIAGELPVIIYRRFALSERKRKQLTTYSLEG